MCMNHKDHPEEQGEEEDTEEEGAIDVSGMYEDTTCQAPVG